MRLFGLKTLGAIIESTDICAMTASFPATYTGKKHHLKMATKTMKGNALTKVDCIALLIGIKIQITLSLAHLYASWYKNVTIIGKNKNIF